MRVRSVMTILAAPVAVTTLTAIAAVGPPSAQAATAAARAPSVTAPARLSVRAWGDDSAGELGDGTFTARSVPAAVGGLSSVGAIAAGGRHGLALLTSGTVLAWGDDTFGQDGNGKSSSDAELPVPVKGLSKVVKIAAGGEHSLALLANGTVLAWGDNFDGQLGDGSTTSSTVPVPVKGLTHVTAISAGDSFSLAVLANGTVMAWGDNSNGQLGNGTNSNTSDVPVQVSGLHGAIAVAAGGQHSLALESDGTVMAWGEDGDGQLGTGSQADGSTDVPGQVEDLTNAVAVAAGSDFSLALTADGVVKGWGDNGFFELAHPDGFPGGIQSSDVPVTIPGTGKATAIAAGGLFGLALRENGTVMGWGDNAFGQLGNGNTNTVIPPTEVEGLTGARAISAGGPFAAALTTAAAPRSPMAMPSPWNVVPTPGFAPRDITDLELNAVSASGPDSAWAVGTNEVSSQQPLAEEWTGKSWTAPAVPSPAGAGESILNGVDDLGAKDAWAVGTSETAFGTSQRTLIEHWNGTKWTIVPSPDPETGSGAFDELNAISGTGPDNLWAAGSFSDGSDFIALLVEHWNGHTWSFIQPPTELATQFGDAITVISAKNVWVVGDTGSKPTVTAHWNGKTWTEPQAPFPQNGNEVNQLTGVSAAGPDDVWASGYSINAPGAQSDVPYMLHWTGSAWTMVTVPNPGTVGSVLRGTTVVSPTDVWSVGITDEDDGGLLSLIEHFNGSTWTVSPSPDPGQSGELPDDSLQAVISSPGSPAWAVGAQEVAGQCCLRTLAVRTAAG
jgi:alpha-tubulin suppressor-like RCC1 family protein